MAHDLTEECSLVTASILHMVTLLPNQYQPDLLSKAEVTSSTKKTQNTNPKKPHKKMNPPNPEVGA